MDPRDHDRLERALKSARIAIGHVASGGADWRDDQKTIDAAAKRVEEVAEQLKRVSPRQQAAMPGIAWKEAKGMREVLAHDYDEVDIEVLADVVDNDLPALIRAIEGALGSR
ncbi:MAG: HepT-like ribonuclease domain-containing protein [Chloroflexota bacterium]